MEFDPFCETFTIVHRNFTCEPECLVILASHDGERTVKSLVYRPGSGALMVSRVVLAVAMLGGTFAAPAMLAQAPAPAAAAAGNRALGTVKSVSGTALSITTDAGKTVAVTLGDSVRVQQLAPGSTDLKTAQPSTADQIAVGDRVLVSGSAGAADALTATRVILMKSSDIAQRNQSTQADWNRRGSGGIVTAVDPAANTIAVSSGTRKLTLSTTGSTIYRRYAPGSVKFEEAKPGTLADLKAGDQLRVRGDRSADGLTITAEEIVSGSFKNLSGTIVSINAAGKSFVIKDLATKKNETVAISDESDLRALPPEMAARFAPGRTRTGGASGAGGTGGAGSAGARAAGGAGASTEAAPAGTDASAPGGATQGGAAPNGAAPTGATPGGAAGAGARPGRPAADPSTLSDAAATTPADGAPARRSGGGAGASGGAGYGAGAGAGGARPGGARGGAADLSQLIPRLPKATLAELKSGQALMIVASGSGGGGPYTAITVLSGVEPLLTGPAGSEITLPPWSAAGGGGGAEGGGGGAAE